MLRSLSIAWVGAAMVAGTAMAQEAKKESKPPAGQEMKLESTAPDLSKCCSGIRFGEELGLALPSLETLGMRVEQVRHDSDPVRLASLAAELKAAEEVSGKKAKVTGEELEQEAVTLALFRAIPAEIKMLSMMVDDDECKQRLGELLPEAEERAEEVKLQTESGAKPMGIEGSAIIYNEGHEDLDIYINGVHRGHLHAHETGGYFVGDSVYGQTLLVARTNFGEVYHQQVNQPVHGNWTWVIHGH